MDKLEALQAMLEGKYICAARYGSSIYFYDDSVSKFCLFDIHRGSMRFTDINTLNDSIELAMFSEFEDATKYIKEGM